MYLVKIKLESSEVVSRPIEVSVLFDDMVFMRNKFHAVSGSGTSVKQIVLFLMVSMMKFASTSITIFTPQRNLFHETICNFV